MSKQKKVKRKTIRGKGIHFDTFYHCLYGSLFPSRFVKAYCELHKCHLSAENIKDKKCNKKHCIHLKEIDVSKQPK